MNILSEILILFLSLGLGVTFVWVYNAERRLQKLEGKEVKN